MIRRASTVLMINYDLADICDLVSVKNVIVSSLLCERRHCQRFRFLLAGGMSRQIPTETGDYPVVESLDFRFESFNRSSTAEKADL